MEKRRSLLLLFELTWWVVTAVLVVVILYPIHDAMYYWPFETWNIIFIVTLITLARYIFLLKHTFLAKRQVLKVVIILLLFPATFLMISGLHGFILYIEENTWESLTGHLPAKDKKAIESYIWTQMVFFGVGSILSALAFAARLFMSIWRTRNRGTV